MLVGAHAEVLVRLTGILGSTEDQSVASSRGAESQLVQGDRLTAGSNDASAGSSGKPESSDSRLGESEQAVVISDSAHDDNGALLLLLVDVGNYTGQRDRRAVDLRHEQAAEHDLVEGSIGSAYINQSVSSEACEERNAWRGRSRV